MRKRRVRLWDIVGVCAFVILVGLALLDLLELMQWQILAQRACEP